MRIDEIKAIRGQNEGLLREVERGRDQENREKVYKELQGSFEGVKRINGELRARLGELSEELEGRDRVMREWNETLGSVEGKIIGLERENGEIKEESIGLMEENRRLRRIVEELEETNGLLQGKYEAVERLVDELKRENKVAEALREVIIVAKEVV